jgi:hypothetical protein
MRFIDKLQYITLFLLSFIIIGAASVITGDIGLNLFKEPSFYLNQLLTYAAIMCVTFAVLYAYLDKFKETDEEYLANMTYIKDFALSKNNVPSILSRYLEKTNRYRKIKQFEHNIKKALFKLDNEKKYKLFGPNKYFTEEDLYLWNHGTLEEKKANAYCMKRMLLEEQLNKDYIEKVIDLKLVKYDKITSQIILGGFYKEDDNNSPNEFITKHPEAKVAKYKIPQLLYSFSIMFILSSLVFGELTINTNTVVNFCIKVAVLVWNSYTSLRFAKTYSQSVTLKDTRFRRGVIIEYLKWLQQEASKVNTPEVPQKILIPEEVDTDDSRRNPSLNSQQLEV